MNNRPIRNVFLLVAALVLTSCGGETSDSPDSTKAADSSPQPSPTESESASQVAVAPSGTLATKPVPCKKFSAPAGFKEVGAMPPVMCAFESSDARVSVMVGGGPPSFEQLQQFEEGNAKANGVTPPVLEQVTADGWTFAAVWPELGGFNRVDRYLVDSAGIVLTCKVGVQGGKFDATTHADFCEDARGRLFKP